MSSKNWGRQANVEMKIELDKAPKVHKKKKKKKVSEEEVHTELNETGGEK